MPAFQGKSVLVLGGSRSLGATIVRRFAAEGATVAFTYAASGAAAEALARETGATAHLTDSADRDAVIARVASCGPLDVLVINSGVAIFGDPLEQDPDAIERLIRINTITPISPRSRPRGRCPTAAASS
ncbi:SDR family NAD(P)-dependent oxidoreductase [Paracoccus cavernae]|uniref:SDR family NAD(P)-dependent oxidoreductase n=1 Tax=Paracoccus cavernae TaxID=1571207 RepID=A0ABT8D5Q1_9RHOB|nr:SDR family NAD(P)-dependent oxidoreductase [Paracoccus cavernae]